MRMILTVLATLALTCVVFSADPPCRLDANGNMVCPTGFHSHVRTDGVVITHSDSNFGNAAAHDGVAWPWVKTSTTVVGQTYVLDTSARAILFPRVRETLSGIRHNVSMRLHRIFNGGLLNRFRR